jgi:hypothetical protein
MSKGVIYYNTNTKCVERLFVSIYSLRKHETCPVTILSQGVESHEYCYKIAKCFSNVNVVETDFGVEDGPNKPYMEKCLLHLFSPYEISIFIDADTLIIKSFSRDIFEETQRHDFCVTKFADWTTDKNSIKKRINTWKHIYPEYMEEAFKYGPALNCGVYAFNRSSEFMNKWYYLAEPGRDVFIPDETCLQVVIHNFKHKVLDQRFNRSCKYDNVENNDTRIIHYHGSKHCRIDENNKLLFNAKLWCDAYNEIFNINLAGIREWGYLGDRMLYKYKKRE